MLTPTVCGRSSVGKESWAYSELDKPRRRCSDTRADSCTHCGTEAQSECATILCANPMRTEYEAMDARSSVVFLAVRRNA